MINFVLLNKIVTVTSQLSKFNKPNHLLFIDFSDKEDKRTIPMGE